MENNDNTLKSSLKGVHESAFEAVKSSMPEENLCSIISFVTDTLVESKDLKEATGKLKEKYGEASVVYIKEFVRNGVPQVMDHMDSDGVKKIDKERFADNLVDASDKISQGIKEYCKSESDDEDAKVATLVNTICESGIGGIGLDVLQGLGVDSNRIGSMTEEGFQLSYKAMAYVCFMEAFKILAKAEKDAEIQSRETAHIMMECSKSIAMIREYRLEMNKMVSDYFTEHMDVFNHGFKEMDEALIAGDTNGFIKGNVEIQKVLNYDVQFTSKDEFDSLMNSDKPFKL